MESAKLEPDQIRETVKKYYTEKGLGEWDRLTKHPYNRLELDTTMFFLNQYLPKKGIVLDAGGGPGRYTIELAKRGFDVILNSTNGIPASLQWQFVFPLMPIQLNVATFIADVSGCSKGHARAP